jgi:hypothetical protein
MAFDFNAAEEQKTFAAGPVPVGSIVMLKLEIQRPNEAYAAKPGSYVQKTKSGLYSLNCQFTVQHGTYAGYHWFENFLMPEGVQQARLTDGQLTACRISYSRMRAIIEAHRRIDPKDQSQRARAARNLADWMDLNGMQFPCRLGLKKEPREYTRKDGSKGLAWDNTVSFILPCTDKRFAEVVNGGEIITDGATQGDAPASISNDAFGNGGNGYGNGNSNVNSMGQEVPGWDVPPTDDVPF